MGKRERLLLKVAAMLHDCGKYISLANSAICAYQIIRATEIIGLTHLEREMVASVVLYNSSPLDPYEELADRMDQHSYCGEAGSHFAGSKRHGPQPQTKI